jgi:L-threonylcarbamoyladenylate synthase
MKSGAWSKNRLMSQECAPEILRPGPDAYARATRILRGGDLVAFPTETVYGLGADATNDAAVAKIFAAKERPRFNPLIVHLHDLAAAEDHARFDARARRLAEAFWPGPLTLVLPRREKSGISLLCSAGLDTLALRVPRHPVARTLIETCGLPLAAPSANLSGKVSPTTAAHVARSLGGRAPLILDGGPCAIGLESSVVAVADGDVALLRPGGVPRDQIESVIGPLREEKTEDAIRSPGQLESHYAPDCPLRLDANEVGPQEALLAFGPEPLKGAKETINLSETGDVVEAAAGLFAALHRLDRRDIRGIAVMSIPREGLGIAINDRLRRAAAPADSLSERESRHA